MRTTTRLLLFLAMLLTQNITSAQSGYFILADYPRYEQAPSPTNDLALRNSARAIAYVLSVGGSVDVSIYGHADFDTSKSAEEILDISIGRARNAEKALRSYVNQEAAALGQAARTSAVTIRSTGMGTSKPVFNPSPTPDKQAANRRVDVFWTVTAAPPAPPTASAFQRCKSVLPTIPAAGPRRRLDCVCTKLQQAAPPVGDTYYDYRAKLQVPGSAGWPSLTPDQWNVALGSFVRHLRSDIQNGSGAPADADFAANLAAIDDSVGRNINDFQTQTNAGAATGVLDLLLLGDIQSRMKDPNHTYSCYAGYSRAHHSQ